MKLATNGLPLPGRYDVDWYSMTKELSLKVQRLEACLSWIRRESMSHYTGTPDSCGDCGVLRMIVGHIDRVRRPHET
jgi:hypothetical protein